MKIAIHDGKGFNREWIKYCRSKNIQFKIVKCYSNCIIESIKDCDVLMWHYHHANSKDTLFARQLLNAVEASGKVVYPDFNSGWFFDDKVGQKYLLEAIDAPFVPSYVFYSKREAFNWIKQATFPKVFKLRKGSGSANVRLIKNRKEAMKIVKKAFRFGFRQYDPWGGLKERWRIVKLGQSNIRDLIEGIGRFFIETRFERIVGREKGYIYFQDFIEGCTYDIRTTIIGDKCYALKRLVRKNDFRASGSHIEFHDPEDIPREIIKTSFQISKRLNLQSVAFDFLVTHENRHLLTELSYAFGFDEGDSNHFWDSELNFHREPFDPFGEMVANVIRKAKLKRHVV